MHEQAVREAFIYAYRSLVEARYDYDTLQAKHPLPPSFDRERLERFRTFFLTWFYPTPEKRAELDASFAHLQDYIRHPDKLLRIVIDSGKLMLQLGRHLPRVVQSGLHTFQSFLQATRFEEHIIQEAIRQQIPLPISREHLLTLLGTLSMEDIDRFMAHNEALFATLHDQPLVQKILTLMKALIAKMEERPQTWAPEEVQALRFGYELLQGGNDLFNQLSLAEQEQITEYILQVERSFWEEVVFSNLTEKK
ncbi:MAG: hypothetical protein R2795_06515 [Saprospiraceae bacterium]